ncbi:MAG: FTR1 family protein [Actinomycetota bacterium]
MLATFIIFLREGIEASLIISILLTYLQKTGQEQYRRDVFIGVASALLLTVVGGSALYFTVSTYSGSRFQQIFETFTFLVAAIFLTLMTLWMQRHSRQMRGELTQQSELAISKGGRFSMGLLAFQSVGREGLETMVFTLAILFANSHQSAAPLQNRLLIVGGALGLAVAIGVAYAIFKLGAKVNLGLFFKVIGAFLMLCAAGLIADAVENLQRLGWVTLGNHTLWNTSGIISEHSNVGDVLHQFLGYAEQPTSLQVLMWALYLVGTILAFRRYGQRQKNPTTV